MRPHVALACHAQAGALLAANNVRVSLASCNVLAGLTGQLTANQIPAGCATSGQGFWPTSGNNSILNLPGSTSNFFSPSAEFGYSYNGGHKKPWSAEPNPKWVSPQKFTDSPLLTVACDLNAWAEPSSGSAVWRSEVTYAEGQ